MENDCSEQVTEREYRIGTFVFAWMKDDCSGQEMQRENKLGASC